MNGVKYLKLQKKIMDDYDKKIMKNKSFPWFCYIDDEKKEIAVTQGHAMAFIPQELFYLNADEILASFNAKGIIGGSGDTQSAELTNTIEVLGKYSCRLIINIETEEVIAVDEKLLTTFFDIDDCYFTASKPNAPVFLWNKYSDELVGLILPVSRKG